MDGVDEVTAGAGAGVAEQPAMDYEIVDDQMPRPALPTKAELLDLARAVRDARANVAATRAVLEPLEKAYVEANADAIAARTTANQVLELAEQTYKQAALAVYNDSLERKPGPGAEVKGFTVMSYSAQVARDWAVDHDLAEMLTLDKKKFEAVAAVLKLDFVMELVDNRVQLATDMDKAIAAAEKSAQNDVAPTPPAAAPVMDQDQGRS